MRRILGNHLIFRISKGGVTENFGRIQRGALEFAWKVKTCGGDGEKSSNVIRGDQFSEVTFKGGIG